MNKTTRIHAIAVQYDMKYNFHGSLIEIFCFTHYSLKPRLDLQLITVANEISIIGLTFLCQEIVIKYCGEKIDPGKLSKKAPQSINKSDI